MKLQRRVAFLLTAVLVFTGGYAFATTTMKMTTPIPSSITTPDSVDSRIGTLKFVDGYPDDATTQKVTDRSTVPADQ